MEPTKSTALARRSTDLELMPPPPKRIKRPKNVIDEELYTDAISEIIARDFFPGLLETETQQEYLDALESGDTAWIANTGRRLHNVMAPSTRRTMRGTSIHTPLRALDTPRDFTGDTPMSVASEASSFSRPGRAPDIDTNMSLDKFQSLYTSEDNESFYKLLDKQNHKRAEKYAWMWSANNKLPSKMMLKQKEVESKLLLSRGSLEDDGGEESRLAIRDRSEKPARPDAWKSKPNNSLMFAPESVEDSIETTAQRAEQNSKAEPKAISHANTRLPPSTNGGTSPTIPSSPSLSAVRDAIAGRRRPSDLESGTAGSETPRINGYTFVDDEDAEPSSPVPIIDLGRGDPFKNPFVIKEHSRREDLHHRIVDKNARSKRFSFEYGYTGKVDSTLVPKFPSSPRVLSNQLTPAGQRLWSKVGGLQGRTVSKTFSTETSSKPSSRPSSNLKPSSSLRSRWTPDGK